MAGLEILSPEGLRLDGRRPHELRKIVCRMGVFRQADGSAYIEMGNTKALATVYGPHEVTNKSKILHDRVLLNCQFSMATFSTGERKKRPKGDRRSTETSMLIRRTFEAAILTQLYPRSQNVQVISIVLVVVHPSLRVAVPSPRGKTFFLGGRVRLHVGHVHPIPLIFLTIHQILSLSSDWSKPTT